MSDTSGLGHTLETLAFFGPFWATVFCCVVAGLFWSHRRRVRERNQATDLMHSLLANPKLTPDDIEQLMRAWWGKKVPHYAPPAATFAKNPIPAKQLSSPFSEYGKVPQ